MTKSLVQRPRAVQDLDEMFAYLRRDSLDAAQRFLDDVERCYQVLCDQPGIGSPRHSGLVPDLPQPLRFHPLKEFPRVLIYYMDRPDAVEVIRIWDAARGLAALVEGLEEGT